ncbi:hypothetical protein [Acinetobacter soli]|uniref:hypothetical protein n=1 Tax=Acinetobacter soli TaxID=487316 RepID=UPI00125FB46D|nr:hypothetical protein [Acinetobacter soli]
MLKKMFVVTIMSICFVSYAEARGNQPCSKSKGGIKACTAEGKFLCNDGSVSASKRKCAKV